MKHYIADKATWIVTINSPEHADFTCDLSAGISLPIGVKGVLNIKSPEEYSIEILRTSLRGGGRYNEMNFSPEADRIKAGLKTLVESFVEESRSIYDQIHLIAKDKLKLDWSDIYAYQKLITVNDFLKVSRELTEIWNALENKRGIVDSFVLKDLRFKKINVLKQLLKSDSKGINQMIQTLIIGNFESNQMRTFFNMTVYELLNNDLSYIAKQASKDDSGLKGLHGCLVPASVFQKLNPKYTLPLLNKMAEKMADNFETKYSSGAFFSIDPTRARVSQGRNSFSKDYILGFNYSDIGTFKINSISPSRFSDPSEVARELIMVTAPLNSESLKMTDCTLICALEILGYEALDNKRSIERAKMVLKTAS